MAKRVGGRGSAPDPAGGAYDAPQIPISGLGRGHPQTPPRSAPSALELAFPLLLIYEMTTVRETVSVTPCSLLRSRSAPLHRFSATPAPPDFRPALLSFPLRSHALVVA